jgi:hypothetical protein
MINGYDALRAAYVNQRVQPVARVTLRGDRLDFSVQRYNITHAHLNSGNPVSDDFFDSGAGKIQWGDQDISGSTILNVFPTAIMKDINSAAWAASIDDGDVVAIGGTSPTARLRMRAGLIAKAGGDWRCFYVDADNHLHYKDLAISGSDVDWSGSESAAQTLPTYVTGTGLGVAPATETSCFVLGYSAPCLWIRYYDFAGSPGAMQIVRVDASLHWQDATWLDCEPMLDDATKYILTCPTGPDGQIQAIIYDTVTDTYSPPFFILATPGSDWLRRIWVTGLSTVNGRVWAVVLNDVQGGVGPYYAQHLALASTTDGKFWRDEGYASVYQVRGKLLTAGDYAYIASHSMLLRSTSCYRLGQDVSSRKRVVNNRRTLSLQNSGLNNAPQLTLGMVADDGTVIEPGARVDLEIMAYGVPDILKVFSGRVDQPTHTSAIGTDEQSWLCRGNMARALGDTAYTPLTTLEWKGRQEYYTNFQVGREPIMGLAVYADDGGYWEAVRHPATNHGCLQATASGVAVVPLRWQDNRLLMRMKCDMPHAGGFVFYIADDERYDKERWEAGILNDDLYIGYRSVDALDAPFLTVVATGDAGTYTAGEEIELLVSLSEAAIKIWRVEEGVAVGSWKSLSYAGWDANGGQTIDTPHPHAIGVYFDIVSEDEDEEPTGEEAHVTEFYATDGGYPMTVQEALIGLFNICGTTATGSVYTYTGTGPLTNTVDALVTVTDEAQGLTLFSAVVSGNPHYELRVSDAQTELYFDDGATETLKAVCPHHIPLDLSGGGTFRVVIHDDAICIYSNDVLVGAMRFQIPRHRYYVESYGGSTFTMVDCHQTLQTGQSQWIAWDAGQPAMTILQNLLNQRRVYLLERGNGVVQIRSTQQSGAILIDDDHIVNSQTYYRTTVMAQTMTSDLREYTGIIGVTDVEGGRVYLLIPELAPYTSRIAITDSERVSSEADALREAELLRAEARRITERAELTMFMDPAMEPGDRFALSDWTGIVVSYTMDLEMSDRLTHSLSMQAHAYIEPFAIPTWDNFQWDRAKWG